MSSISEFAGEPVSFGPAQVDWETRIDFARMQRERRRKTEDAMKRADVDYLMLLRYENSRYSVGIKRLHFPTIHLGGGPLVVLARTGDPSIWAIDPDFVSQTFPSVPRERIHPPHQMDLAGDVRRFVRELRDDFGSAIETARIAVDIWSPAMFAEIQAALPKAEFINGQEIMLRARSIKTVDEIQCLKMGYAISEAAMQAAVDTLRPGLRECELAGTAFKKMSDFNSEAPQCSEVVNSGPCTYPYRRFHSDRIIQHGEIVNMDFGGCFNGYFGDFCRSFVVGDKPTPAQRDLFKRAYERQLQTLQDLRPGASPADLCSKQGRSNLAHGIGISAYEPPHIREVDEYEIKPGMVFCLITLPVGGDGVGAVHFEDQVVITESGAEVYSTYPHQYCD